MDEWTERVENRNAHNSMISRIDFNQNHINETNDDGIHFWDSAAIWIHFQWCVVIDLMKEFHIDSGVIKMTSHGQTMFLILRKAGVLNQVISESILNEIDEWKSIEIKLHGC